MGLVIVPGSPDADPTPFLRLIRHPQEHRRVVAAFMQTLAGSFELDKQRNGAEFAKRIHTQSEERRRSEIIARWFRRLRGDLGFSLSRALDELPRALRAELDGGSYTPPEGNTLWAPGGA